MCDKDDVLEGRVPAEFTEHPKVVSGDFGESLVGNAVDADDCRKLESVPVPIQTSSRWNWPVKRRTHVGYKNAAISS